MNLVIEIGLKEALKPELTRLNSSLEEFSKGTDGFLGDLLGTILRGSGKRVRPALVFLSARFGNSPLESVRTVAKAVEMIHIATLVHDDVIDQAALRRGQKTVYNEHGVDTAVLLGDHVYTHAFEQVAKLNHPEILALMASSTSLMCAGEIEQLKKRFKFDLSEEEYFSFIRKKTASLFGVSARAGAILAGLGLAEQIALEEYGTHLGIAFQITDDLLDLTGEEAVVGKTLRTDITNGKITLPLIHYREQLTHSGDRLDFYERLRHPNGEFHTILDRMKQSGSVVYAESMAHSYVKRALQNLNALEPCEARDHLVSLAELLLKRNA